MKIINSTVSNQGSNVFNQPSIPWKYGACSLMLEARENDDDDDDGTFACNITLCRLNLKNAKNRMIDFSKVKMY